jgi:hypothetical protein
MAITYYMLQISPVLFFILIVSFGALFAGVSTFLFRKYTNIKILRAHNEVIGFLYLSIASFYALLLSFIVLVVWDQLNETTGNVSKEGSSAMGLYRDIKYYPDTTNTKPLLTAYLDFVYNVVDDEFPKMEHMKISRKTPESLNRVFYIMERLDPKTPKQVQLVGEMFRHLNELSIYRGLRTTSMETEISPPMWLPIILGALVTLFCTMLLDIEHIKIHILLNCLLGAFIAMFMFIIIILDHPYSGKFGLKPKSYREIFTLEQWAHENNDYIMPLSE